MSYQLSQCDLAGRCQTSSIFYVKNLFSPPGRASSQNTEHMFGNVRCSLNKTPVSQNTRLECRVSHLISASQISQVYFQTSLEQLEMSFQTKNFDLCIQVSFQSSLVMYLLYQQMMNFFVLSLVIQILYGFIIHFINEAKRDSAKIFNLTTL